MILSSYYRQKHYHPAFALRNTLGLLIQIPFFIAAYSYLSHLKILVGASFLFLPDLSAPDSLLTLDSRTGKILSIHLLPILMTVVNCISGAVYTRGLQAKDKIQVYGTALVFLVLLYNAPSGLVFYWLLNNIFSLLKNGLQGIKKPTGNTKNASSEVLPDNRLSSKRCLVFSSLILFLLAGLVIPCSLIASSVEEFSFIESYTSPFPFIVNTLTQSAALFLFWPLCIYFLSPKKAGIYINLGMALLAVFALINSFIFPGNYGFLNTSLILSEPELLKLNNKITLSNIPALTAAASLVFFLYYIKKKVLYILQLILLLSLSGFAVINLAAIYRGYSEFAVQDRPGSAYSGKQEPVYRFSKTGNNVLIIMLDRAIGGYLPYILREKPDIANALLGFTWYPNSVSFGGWTIFGAPPLFGGYEYTPLEMQKRSSEPLKNKHNEALLVLPRLFSDLRYTVTVTNPPWANYSLSSDISIFNDYPEISAKNIIGAYSNDWLKKHPGVQSISVSELLKNNLIRFSLFKSSPMVFRKFIYDNGEWLAGVKTEKSKTKLPKRMLDNYIALDILPEITEVTPENINTFTILVNDITHEPAFLKEPDYNIILLNEGTPDQDSHFRSKHYHVNMAAFLLLEKWLSFLKENGVYDNTKIIIVSDHGSNLRSNYRNNIMLPNREYVQTYNPLLLVKDFNKHGEMIIDNSFMSNADVPLLALNGIIKDPVNPFTLKPLRHNKKNGLTITTSKIRTPGRHFTTRFRIRQNEWLHVHDNIFEPANWTKTAVP